MNGKQNTGDRWRPRGAARGEARMSGGGTVPIGYFLAANSAMPPKLSLLPINDGDAAEAAVVDAWIRIDPFAGLSRIFLHSLPRAALPLPPKPQPRVATAPMRTGISIACVGLIANPVATGGGVVY